MRGEALKSVRGYTGTANALEGDWHAMFTKAGIPATRTEPSGQVRALPFNERLLKWINFKMGRTFTNLPEAQQAFAASKGASNWTALGTFTP